jgi:hypothetical protein
MANGRAKGAAYEVRWLNLAGLCTRPGFGSALDEWRVSELRRIYAAGLAFPRETQNQVEWLVLWQRVGAGFSAGQQRELAQRVSGSWASASASRRASTRKSSGRAGGCSHHWSVSTRVSGRNSATS